MKQNNMVSDFLNLYKELVCETREYLLFFFMLGVMKAYFEPKSDKLIYHKYLQITSKTVGKMLYC